MVTRIPGDLDEAAIERIMTHAQQVRRRYGADVLAGMTWVRDPQRVAVGAASTAVLAALREQPRTVYALACALHWDYEQIHGVMSWLRKQNKITVHHWVTSPKKRRRAVYQVTA